MPDETEYRTIVLAALLHDIGKLLHRGTFPGMDVSGPHPVVSANFVSAFKDLFAPVADADLLKTLVQRHHENPRMPPETLVQNITDPHVKALATLVSRADNLSSSERGQAIGVMQPYKAVPLASVVERLNRPDDSALILRYRPRRLAAADAEDMNGIFPDKVAQLEPAGLTDHIKAFGNDFRALFGSAKWDYERLFSHLHSILQRYAWCIASNTQEAVPDISLFDHLRTTAAIAACLYRYHTEKGTLSERGIDASDSPRFILAVGDLSGIQSYIFDIAGIGPGGAARRLRARSLYVQLCAETSAHRILHQLDLTVANVLMNSGGRYHLLLPNVSDVRATLKNTQGFVDKWFWEELNGELALNLAWVEFDDEGFAPSDSAGGTATHGFGEVLLRAGEVLQARKKNRFVEVLRDGKGWREDAFIPPARFAGENACRSCHKFPLVANDLCRHCARDAETGAMLVKGNCVSFFADPATGRIPVLGYSASLSEGSLQKGTPYHMWKLNDPSLSDLKHVAASPRYLANHVYMRNGAVATFEQVAKDARGDPPRGAELLGFLKADVDNLGENFVYGLKRDKGPSLDTVSRQATLSRQLDVFFSGWVEHLTSTVFPLCYTVFSGGDDLFIVGPWDRIIMLAKQVRSDFSRYTGNPKVTLSAGIVIARPTYPVATAADQVDKALASSKKHPGKDRMTILRKTVSWQDFDLVIDAWHRLRPEAEEATKVPSAFLYNLLHFSEMWEEYRKGNVLGLRMYPLLAYNVARNLDRNRSPTTYAWSEALLRWPPAPEQEKFLDNLGLITSLLIYSRRGGNE